MLLLCWTTPVNCSLRRALFPSFNYKSLISGWNVTCLSGISTFIFKLLERTSRHYGSNFCERRWRINLQRRVSVPCRCWKERKRTEIRNSWHTVHNQKIIRDDHASAGQNWIGSNWIVVFPKFIGKSSTYNQELLPYKFYSDDYLLKLFLTKLPHSSIFLHFSDKRGKIGWISYEEWNW